jgi:hypothetical protein
MPDTKAERIMGFDAMAAGRNPLIALPAAGPRTIGAAIFIMSLSFIAQSL